MKPNQTPASLEATADTKKLWLELEVRPNELIAGVYEQLPFPNIGPIQEVAFDLGVVVHNGTVELKGIVFQGYNGHQLLFEQRWPARIISQRTGE